MKAGVIIHSQCWWIFLHWEKKNSCDNYKVQNLNSNK